MRVDAREPATASVDLSPIYRVHTSDVEGWMIGSALVGTFLGILLSYGIFEPLAGLLEQKVDESGKELQCIKTTLLASMQGYAPQVAVEFGRKVLYSTERPSFAELEGHVKGKK